MNASWQALEPRGRFPVTILVNNAPMLYPFLFVKSIFVPLILGWDFREQRVKSIPPGEAKMQVNNRREFKLWECLEVKARVIKTKKDLPGR